MTPWTVACQAPLSMGFSRQGYWSGLQCPSPGYLLNPGINPRSPALQADSLPFEPSGNPYTGKNIYYLALLGSFADHCSTLLSLCCHVWLFRSFPDNFSPSKPFVEVHKNQPHFPKSRHLFFLMLWNLPYHISVYPSNRSENELMLHLWYKM